jgi:hypothetical protein
VLAPSLPYFYSWLTRLCRRSGKDGANSDPKETRQFLTIGSSARFPAAGRGPPLGRTSGELMGAGIPHGSSPWAEGPRDSGRAGFHALRVGNANDQLIR